MHQVGFLSNKLKQLSPRVPRAQDLIMLNHLKGIVSKIAFVLYVISNGSSDRFRIDQIGCKDLDGKT